MKIPAQFIMKTRNNIYHDLNYTEFIYVFDKDILFYFSSDLHLRKFKEMLNSYQINLKKSNNLKIR